LPAQAIGVTLSKEGQLEPEQAVWARQCRRTAAKAMAG
jgi:hypothetical protein